MPTDRTRPTGGAIVEQHTDVLRHLFAAHGSVPVVLPTGEEWHDAAAVVAALQLEATEARELAEIAAYVPDPQDEPVDLDAWREDVCGWRDRLAEIAVEVPSTAGDTRALVPLSQVCVSLLVYSEVPEAQAYLRWLCKEFMPAIRQYGHYDPARNHEPPVGGELDALERREGARDVLNALVPGMGDWLAQAEAAPEEAC